MQFVFSALERHVVNFFGSVNLTPSFKSESNLTLCLHGC